MLRRNFAYYRKQQQLRQRSIDRELGDKEPKPCHNIFYEKKLSL